MSAVKVIDEPQRPFFTVRSLADYLQVSERMVRYLLADELPSVKVGNTRRIAAADVDAFIARNRRDPR